MTETESIKTGVARRVERHLLRRLTKCDLLKLISPGQLQLTAEVETNIWKKQSALWGCGTLFFFPLGQKNKTKHWLHLIEWARTANIFNVTGHSRQNSNAEVIIRRKTLWCMAIFLSISLHIRAVERMYLQMEKLTNRDVVINGASKAQMKYYWTFRNLRTHPQSLNYTSITTTSVYYKNKM